MPADVDAVVAEVARAIDADLPQLTTQMTDWFFEVIPEFRQDETARRLMVASTSANLVAIVDMLAHTIPLDQISVPPAAAEYARRFAQHDLSLEALLRAYRLGEHRFVQWALEALSTFGHLDTAAVLAAASMLAERTNRYIDQVVESLIDIYETERRRWDGRTGALRAAQLRMVLDNENLSETSAYELIGVPLGYWHQAAVAWVPTPSADAESSLQVASRLLQRVSGRAPLTVLADDHTLWAWVSAPRPLELELVQLRAALTEHGEIRMAFGAAAQGLPGFRGSLREAQRARSVAETALDQRAQVVAFDEVAVAALLTDQSDDIRRWVERVLPGLTGDDATTRHLRDTLRVYLQANGSYTQAAAQLHLHKNTVHYRVRKAEELRGRPIAGDRLEVEVALLAADLLRSRLR